MGALIVIDVHARDAISELIAKGVCVSCVAFAAARLRLTALILRRSVCTAVQSLDDFEWTRQLRYYWDETIGTSSHCTTMRLYCRLCCSTPHLYAG
jgi:hypothetical protein